MKRSLIYIFTGSLSIMGLTFILSFDIIRGYDVAYGISEWMMIIGLSISMLISILLLFVQEKQEGTKIKIPMLPLNYVEIISFLVVVILISTGMGYYISTLIDDDGYHEWRIGILRVEDPTLLTFSNELVKNPVLTYADVDDVDAKFVADPFMIKDQGEIFMFFEIWNTESDQGDIGYARSSDGLEWDYEKIVLDESFHLSYPYVFKHNNEFYMIPETGEIEEIRLYKAHDFPGGWELEEVLLKGKFFKDSSLLIEDDRFYLFTETRLNRDLRLYQSEDLMGPWVEHPSSPVVKDDPDHARCGGRIVNVGNRTVRFAQDDYPEYGMQVWGFEIKTINEQEYSEEMIGNQPVLTGFENWNIGGVHQIDILELDNGELIACIDGT